MNRVKRMVIPCDVLVRMGREPRDGVPVGVLISWLQDQVPCTIFGSEHIRGEYDHTLSDLEVAQGTAAELTEVFRALTASLPRPGEAMPPAEVEAIRARLRSLGL